MEIEREIFKERNCEIYRAKKEREREKEKDRVIS